MKRWFTDRGGWWVAAQSLLMLAVVLCACRWAGQWHSRLTSAAGSALLLVAAGCGLAGALVLGRSLTPFPRPHSGTTLAQTGIYAWMRHPLYTAVFCAALGVALVCASGPALAAALALGLLLDAKARHEERWLRARFPEYAEYARRVRRFIPGVY